MRNVKNAVWKWAALCLTAAVLSGCAGEDGNKTEMSSDGAVEGLQSGGTENGGDRDGSAPLGTGGQSGGQRDSEALAGDGAGSGALGDNRGAGDGAASADSEALEGDGPEGSEGAAGDAAGEGAAGAQSGRLTGFGEGTDPNRKEMTDAYVSILEDIYFDQIFPDGEEYGYQPGENYDITSNSFAVFDIDFDGEDELIVTYSTTYMAGMRELIYAYDSVSKSVRKEISCFPSMIYYDNGVVREDASHNHGMASDRDFWPYSLYQYDREKDAYVLTAGVDAWSRSWQEEDYEGNPFPEEVDKDGDGLVYYTIAGESNERSGFMDQETYDQWLDSVLEGAGEVKVPYVKLTTDNIYAIE